MASVLAAQPDPSGPARPRLSEFDNHTALLTDIKDRLAEVIAAVFAANGGKVPKIPTSPRPTSGVAKARERQAQQRHLSLVEEVRAAQERWESNQREG